MSPSESPRSKEDEIIALRARNQVLTDALKAIQDTAAKEEKRLYDLVWFARNRSRYPNHQSRYRIESSEEHKKELENLQSDNADFYHGMHAGLLAASRLFKEHSDILHINEINDVSQDLLQEATKHKEKIRKSLEVFPHTHADDFPEAK